MLTMTRAEARDLFGPHTSKRQKFNARKCVYLGQTFGSRKELRRYQALELLHRSGDIVELEAHPVFPLVVNGVHVGRYTADSRQVWVTGEVIVEDVKGGQSTKTTAYRLRKRVWEALYAPLTITEV